MFSKETKKSYLRIGSWFHDPTPNLEGVVFHAMDRSILMTFKLVKAFPHIDLFDWDASSNKRKLTKFDLL